MSNNYKVVLINQIGKDILYYNDNLVESGPTWTKEESSEVEGSEGPSTLKLKLKYPFDILGVHFYSVSTISVGFTSCSIYFYRGYYKKTNQYTRNMPELYR